jgi:DNA helicase-2/ATP-dependent DNA helicase PcrA
MRLTDRQVVAAAAEEPLVNIVSAPGSGKTTVAAERFGYLRFRGIDTDLRGIIGVSFTRAAAGELVSRIRSRWGSSAIAFPHLVSTFDDFHVRLLHGLLRADVVRWPGGLRDLTVIDEYRGCRGFRWLIAGGYRRVAKLNAGRIVVSDVTRLTQPRNGIGNVADHRQVLSSGIVSHEDVRSILLSALAQSDIRRWVTQWMAANYRALVVDEVYDADRLDLTVAGIAINAGLMVTLIGDPWQALYGWRGATPELVQVLLNQAPFVEYEQPESFRFEGPQMPALAADLRSGNPVFIPDVDSSEVDVALARRWRDLWDVGDNVLPLAFRSVGNQIDAMLNIMLDQVTSSCLGRRAFGWQSSCVQLGLEERSVRERQADIISPVVAELVGGKPAAQVLEALRDAATALGAARRPNRLRNDGEIIRESELLSLRRRLMRRDLVPGLTVHQAKGCEWPRVGVVLREADTQRLATGLHALEPEDCVLYVALTRARRACGRLVSSGQGQLDLSGPQDLSDEPRLI